MNCFCGYALWLALHLREKVCIKVRPEISCCLLLLQILDVDGNQSLSYEELRDGMLRLRVFPAIALTEEDFEHITEVICILLSLVSGCYMTYIPQLLCIHRLSDTPLTQHLQIQQQFQPDVE